MTIEIFEPPAVADDEPTLLDKIKIMQIDSSRVAPVNVKVGSQIPMTELANLIAEIHPVDPLQQEEPDTYYAQNISVCGDGDLSPKKINIPYHIAVRVVLASFLTKYGASENRLIEIS